MNSRSWRNALVGLMAALAWAIPAAGQPGTAEVSIRCDRLSVEERARVEVQVLSELRTVSHAPGRLTLSCDSETVRGGWDASGTLLSERRLSVGPRDDLTDLLLWLASLLMETASDGTLEPVPPISRTDAPTSEGDAAAPPVSPGAPSAEARQAPKEVPAQPEASPAPPAPHTEPLPNAAPKKLSEKPRATPGQSRRPHLGFGVLVAPLDGAIPIAAGGRVGVEVPLLATIGASAALSLMRGLVEPSGIALWEGEALLLATWEPLPWAEILVGPMLSYANVTRASSTLDSWSIGGEGSVLVAYPVGPVQGFVQAGVHALLSQRRATVLEAGGTQALPLTILPHWHAFFALGLRLELGQAPAAPGTKRAQATL